jgi:hypothetical protein
MDGVYPTSYCSKQPVTCCGNKTESTTGGTWVSNAFIRNRGQTSFATEVYDEGWPDYLTNNPPPTPLYVRVAPSQTDPKKMVYWINGWERPRLILTCGRKYQFNVNTCGYPFYFTTDSKGGQGNKDPVSQVVPSDFYVYTYTMNPGVPQEFYYQCANISDMGGKVLVKAD